jgi:hypothetical protein
MTERDTDIDFDFFDEPATQETTQRRRAVRGPRRPGPPPRRPHPPTGVTPLLRLVGLIAFAIFIVVLLVLLVQSCRGASKQKSYRNYMQDVSQIAQGSASVGRDMSDTLTTPGARPAQLAQGLERLAQRQSQYAAQAQQLHTPGPLRVEHQHLIEVLQLRSSGLSRLADAFRQTASSKDVASAGALLADQAQLLAASDVNYDFYFREPSIRELRRQGITGVAVPESKIVANRDFTTARAMTLIFQRSHGAQTGGTPTGLHGTGLVSTKVLPGGIILSTSQNDPIPTSTDLGFEVAVKDTGDSQEVRIPVTLTIGRPANQGGPIVRKARIDVIDPGETKTVRFGDLPQVPFGVRTTVKVDVKPVRGETRISNNSASYPVIFSLVG